MASFKFQSSVEFRITKLVNQFSWKYYRVSNFRLFWQCLQRYWKHRNIYHVLQERLQFTLHLLEQWNHRDNAFLLQTISCHLTNGNEIEDVKLLCYSLSFLFRHYVKILNCVSFLLFTQSCYHFARQASKVKEAIFMFKYTFRLFLPSVTTRIFFDILWY